MALTKSVNISYVQLPQSRVYANILLRLSRYIIFNNVTWIFFDIFNSSTIFSFFTEELSAQREQRRRNEGGRGKFSNSRLAKFRGSRAKNKDGFFEK